jgi:hypothetical protein
MKTVLPSLLLSCFAILVPLHRQDANIQRKVSYAIDEYLRDNTKPLEAMQQDPDLPNALPYIAKYMTNPDSRVRVAAGHLIRVMRTPAAVKILVELMDDRTNAAARFPVRYFYDDYDCAMLRVNGGERLRDSLITFAKTGGVLMSAKPILLLSCVNADETARQFIESERGGIRTVMLDFGMPPVSIRIPLDMVLAHWGRADGVERVQQIIEGGKVDDLFFLLRAMKFINDDSLLKKLAVLLEDKRNVVKVCSECEEYLRVADLAVYAFAERLGPDVLGVKPQDFHRYQDKEVSTAYEKVKAWFKSRQGKTQ